MNTYLSFMNRNLHLREIDSFLAQIFDNKEFLTFEDYIHLNSKVSSELFCSLMALLYHHIPCTKTIHRLHKKFQENSGVDPAKSPKAEMASPSCMASL